MKKLNYIAWILMLFSLFACSPRNPEKMPLYAMNVRQMFPGDREAQKLALAAAKGDIELMNKLVVRGADVNAQGIRGVTLPTWVIYHPNKEGFKRLMELGADPNIHWNNGKTLLHWIAFMTDVIGPEYLQMALEIGGGNPNVSNPLRYGERPIELACMNRKYRDEAFALLYNAGAEIDYKGAVGNPLVDRVLRVDAFEIAYFLLTQGVDYTSDKGSGIAGTVRYSYAKDADGKVYYPENMWFWRCVDFLEKEGVVIDLLSEDQRPTVLDTNPPPILKMLNVRPLEKK
jgi:hypothetical protein